MIFHLGQRFLIVNSMPFKIERKGGNKVGVWFIEDEIEKVAISVSEICQITQISSEKKNFSLIDLVDGSELLVKETIEQLMDLVYKINDE